MNHSVFSLSKTLETIELDHLRGSELKSHIYDFNIPNQLGKGIIRFLKLDLGFRVVVLDCILKTNVQLNLYNTNKKFLYFAYCTEGHVYHKFSNEVKISNIEELSLSIVGSNKDKDSSLLLKHNRPIKLHLVCIDQSVFFKEFIPIIPLEKQAVSKTDELIKALDKLNDYVYNCAINLKFAEQLRALRPLEVADEFIELLDIKSYYLHVLSSYLNEFYKELYVERSSSKLNTYELQQIRKASEFITDNLEHQHSIKSLCLQSGLSPAKLQEGFKSMHGTTVSDFIRNKRLEKAETLFLTTDHNVSEVVYMVGITSRSYFCKIFKAKYGCSPSYFRKSEPKQTKGLKIER
ncbi:helix-turn-helix domain-containing protein [Winogradskyella luteola]|uniref:Helix-turn-helix transcriptional regulator n=1 Tax=Winogradskyella luteola TaxID=2828330 RepID=A0A9X1F7F6_9FLAO|nr:AraC family transcriptional regulator [Winogradskyella luteola]MBV7267843.1 helix-turn-helix transcriptional regulator [Winogradskyella luteola]